MMKEQRLRLRCDFCASSGKPGHLWLGGKDYIECPQCLGAGGQIGVLELVEQFIQPGKVFIPAQRIFSVQGRPNEA